MRRPLQWGNALLVYVNATTYNTVQVYGLKHMFEEHIFYIDILQHPFSEVRHFPIAEGVSSLYCHEAPPTVGQCLNCLSSLHWLQSDVSLWSETHAC